MDSLEKFHLVALDIAEKAGSQIREGFSLDIETSWKEDSTPATQIDLAVNKMVIETIEKEFPTHSVLGEETSLDKGSDYVWVCDPIDGTIPFSRGLNISTFSLALVHDGIPIVGIVYDPFQDLLFSATKGNGAFVNDRKVHVSNETSYEKNVAVVEGPASFALPIMESLSKKKTSIFKFLSFAYGAKNVASGHFICGVFGFNSPWDCAAIKILVEEAGGKSSNLKGEDQRYDRELNGFVVSNGRVHEELIRLINS